MDAQRQSRVQLTVVELDTSATRVAGTTACPVLAATLLPHRNGSNGSSKDGCGGDELLHGDDMGTLIEVLELLTYWHQFETQAVTFYNTPEGLPCNIQIEITIISQVRRTQEAPCRVEPQAPQQWQQRYAER